MNRLKLIAALVLSAGMVHAESTVMVGKNNDVTLKVYGFVENDFTYDTTQSFNEEQGNNAVTKKFTSSGADNYQGQHGRLENSIRNSRLGFEVKLPTDTAVQAKGVLELDLLGNNGPNTAPGKAAGTQNERDFFNNPAMRVRHAYMDLSYGEGNAKIGQTWSLLGWQPYYFPSEVVVQPAVGQLYRRFAQLRLTDTHKWGDAWQSEVAADAAKPAEMDSALPEMQGGLRLSSTKWKAATIGGGGPANMVGLSAAVSGAWIPVRTSVGNADGGAFAYDVFIPVIPSSDGKDRSNNLSFTGEMMRGTGVGGLEYSGLSAGVSGVALSTTSLAAGNGPLAIDSGIAGTDTAGKVELIRYEAYRVNGQYFLPGGKWAVGAGWAVVKATNLKDFGTGSGLLPKMLYENVSLMYEPLAWLRFGLEYGHTVDFYDNDPKNQKARNDRVQFSTFYMF